MNFDKRNPGSENNDLNHQPDLDQKKQELEKKQDFKKLSDANRKKKTNLESRKQLTHLGKEVLKGSIEYQKSQKNTPDYVEQMNEVFTPNNNTQNFNEYIASAKNIPEKPNNLGALASSINYSSKTIIIECIGIGAGIIKCIPDIYSIITGEAEHEGIKNA